MNRKADILEKLKTGDEKAYKVFFYLYYADMVLFANNIIKNCQASEDLIQEMFIEFWFKEKYKQVDDDLDGYLFRSVKNKCLNYLRTENRKNKRLEDIIINEREEFRFNIEEFEEKEEIHRAINKLPEKCKEVFIHCCIYGLKYQEAAEELGVSINTIRTQMGRAFKSLRESLKGKTFTMLLFYALK